MPAPHNERLALEVFMVARPTQGDASMALWFVSLDKRSAPRWISNALCALRFAATTEV